MKLTPIQHDTGSVITRRKASTWGKNGTHSVPNALEGVYKSRVMRA